MDVQELQRWNQVRSNLELLYNRGGAPNAAGPPLSDVSGGELLAPRVPRRHRSGGAF